MLRDYQQEVYNELRSQLRSNRGVCVVLPCRSGKSYIMKEIVSSALKKGSNVLILAHRNLLISQHKKLITNCRIESVFTEVRHLGEKPAPDLIIIDEGHISESETYKKVCEYYDCPRILFTATAKRLDGKPLSLVTSIINGISADELIKRGQISPYDLYAPKLNIDLSKVSMSGSDFNNEQVSEVMLDKKIYGDIIKYYREYANGKQSIAYCCNINHSKSICELFNNNGISAKHIDATTPEKTRERIMDEFKRGEFEVLCNCNLISEGITLPQCECCLLLRPTQSETLYIQQACRCLTPAADKKAVIIDYVGNCYAHGMPTEKRIYTLHEMQRIKNPGRKPEVVCRECTNCLRVYRGNDPICPYCGFNNGKTQKEIENEKEAELARVEAIERKNKRMEVGMAKDFPALLKIGKERGYKNPAAWASFVLRARNSPKTKVKFDNYL